MFMYIHSTHSIITVDNKKLCCCRGTMKRILSLTTIKEYHAINWTGASVTDREPDRSIRWIKEAIHIQKKGNEPLTARKAATNSVTCMTISWHNCYLLCREPDEEMMLSFF